MTAPPVIDALQYSNWSRALFEEWRAGGLDAVHVTVAYWEGARESLSAIGRWQRLFEAHADLIRPATSGEDILAARREGRTAVILGAQNCSPIEDELALVGLMRRLGLMVMQLTYNNQSLIGAGCYEAEDAGISRFGREVIAEMNRHGMVIDLSHSGERTSLEAIALSTRPVAITHANPARFHESVRNKSDRLLRALAEAGGVLGLSLYPHHLPGGSACALETFTAMVAGTVELMGIDHVGIGSDMCRGWGPETLGWMRAGRWTFATGEPPAWPAQPAWFRTPADTPALGRALRARGFADDEVGKIMGGNWLRLFADGFAPRG